MGEEKRKIIIRKNKCVRIYQWYCKFCHMRGGRRYVSHWQRFFFSLSIALSLSQLASCTCSLYSFRLLLRLLLLFLLSSSSSSNCCFYRRWRWLITILFNCHTLKPKAMLVKVLYVTTAAANAVSIERKKTIYSNTNKKRKHRTDTSKCEHIQKN